LGKSGAMVIFPLADVQNHASPRPSTVVSYRHSFLPSACSCILCSSGYPHARTHARTHTRACKSARRSERRAGTKGKKKEREGESFPSFARGDSLSRLRIVEMNLSPENLRKSQRNEKQEERFPPRRISSERRRCRR